MGCWNHTCALTNLPVHAGDEVYVFLLEESRLETPSLCYPNGFWNLIPLYFQGEYNDYGAAENCHGPMLPVLINALKKYLIEFDQGENQYHDIPVNKETLDVDKMFEADHEGRLFINAGGKFYGGGKQRITHIVIHKEVLDSVLEQYTEEPYDFSSGKMDHKTLSFQDFLADARSYAEVLVNLEVGQLHVAMTVGMIDISHKQQGGWFSNYLDANSMMRPSLISPRELIMELMWLKKSLTDSDSLRTKAYEAIEHLAKYFWLQKFMSDGRRMWCPPSGSGSQNSSTQAQRLLANITLKKAHEIDHRWDEEDEE